jgi:hypothetical protein
MLRTAGPFEDHAWSDFVLNRTFSLTLSGVDFKVSNRLGLIDYYDGFTIPDGAPGNIIGGGGPWDNPCGHKPIHTASTDKWLKYDEVPSVPTSPGDFANGLSAFDGMSETFSNWRVGLPGYYMLCWSPVVAGPNETTYHGGPTYLEFDGEVGQITVAGPEPGQSYIAVYSYTWTMTVRGIALTTNNRIKIIRWKEQCGTGPQENETVVEQPDDGSISPGEPSLYTTVQNYRLVHYLGYPNVKMMLRGEYRVCWSVDTRNPYTSTAPSTSQLGR